MADNYIQVAADGSGKKMQTYLNTIGASDVHAEAVVLVDSTGSPLGSTSGALNVYLGSINSTISGTITANQGGAWNIAAVTSITNPVTVQQTNASNFLATVSGSVTANAGTNLNTSNISVKVFQGAAFIAGGQITIGNVATTIAGSRPTRRSVTIRNQDSVNSGFVGPANVNISNGILLSALDSISIDFVGIIQGITAGNNVTFGYLESYD
jgi:hypothetical protein